MRIHPLIVFGLGLVAGAGLMRLRCADEAADLAADLRSAAAEIRALEKSLDGVAIQRGESGAVRSITITPAAAPKEKPPTEFPIDPESPLGQAAALAGQ